MPHSKKENTTQLAQQQALRLKQYLGGLVWFAAVFTPIHNVVKSIAQIIVSTVISVIRSRITFFGHAHVGHITDIFLEIRVHG